jgi:tetratricopeptide (TPR) repeat protein
VTTPSALLRRRLGRVATFVSTLLAGTFALWACGPFFPRWLLGPERLLVPAPEGLLRHEIGRLKLAEPPRAVPAVDPWQQTAESGVADLRKALEAAKVPDGRREALVARYLEARSALSQYASSVTVFENVSEPLYPEEEMEREEPGEPPSLPESAVVPEGLPAEFADYLRGAIAYHRGELDAAISAWEKLLKRPEGERRFRSTWAAFMLGKAQLRAERPAEAVRWFQRTREIAGQKSFEDSLGLAAASLGWEARAERDLGHYDKALVLYARQAKGGDPSGMSSVRFVARQALKAGPDALAPIARSAEARSVLTAFLVSDAGAPWEMWGLEEAKAAGSRTPEIDPAVAAWLAALQKAGVQEVEGADRIAWAAYQGGDFSAARQWLDRARPDAPMARWIRARMLLRDGKIAEAQKLLDETAAALPDPQLTEDEIYFHSEGSGGGKIATPSLATGESAALLTTEGKYIEALDRFLKSGFWVDAAHLADRVIPVDELKAYVDAERPADLVKDIPEWPMYNEGLQTAPSNLIARDIRYLLGRRLVRAGRYDEAKGYLPAGMEPHLDTLKASLLHSRDAAQPADRRAAALFRAACVTRKQGMELMGTELDPDWFLFDGQYEMLNYPEQMEARAENPRLKPGPGEMQRMESHRPEPDVRFHYRYRAAELAREAAGLLPDGSEQKARYLATAGSWLKSRDPEAARPFYKALLDCCSNTKLGQAAQKARWFPEVPECEEE